METLGNYMRQQRQQAGISIEDVANRTKIRSALVRSMEEDRLEDLPGGIFLRGFVRAYMDVVGSDSQRALELLDSGAGPEQPAHVLTARAYVEPEHHNPGRFRLAHLLVLVVALLAMMAAFYLSSGTNRTDRTVTSIQTTDVDSGTTRSFTPPR